MSIPTALAGGFHHLPALPPFLPFCLIVRMVILSRCDLISIPLVIITVAEHLCLLADWIFFL